VGPRASLKDVEKRKFMTLPGLDLQPLASRYTDYAIRRYVEQEKYEHWHICKERRGWTVFVAGAAFHFRLIYEKVSVL
jgi:hypothetical protein